MMRFIPRPMSYSCRPTGTKIPFLSQNLVSTHANGREAPTPMISPQSVIPRVEERQRSGKLGVSFDFRGQCLAKLLHGGILLRISAPMAVNHMDLIDSGTRRQGVLLNAESAAMVNSLPSSSRRHNTHLGFGEYGLRLPINWNMLALLLLPTMGRAVSNGVLGTKAFRLDSAKKGVRPVAVGPRWLRLTHRVIAHFL